MHFGILQNRISQMMIRLFKRYYYIFPFIQKWLYLLIFHLNTFFTNIISNLKIPPYQDTDFTREIDPAAGDDPITKYKNNTKIITAKISQQYKFFVVKTNLSILKL